MRAIRRIFLILTLLLPTIGTAQGPQINVFSFEDASCDAWTKSSGNKLVRAQYEFWIRGFVSGHNYANPSLQVAVGKFPASEVLYQYLDQYCRDNSSSSYIAGVIHLVGQLREPVAAAKSAPAKKEATKASPAVPPKVTTAPATPKSEPAKAPPATK